MGQASKFGDRGSGNVAPLRVVSMAAARSGVGQRTLRRGLLNPSQGTHPPPLDEGTEMRCAAVLHGRDAAPALIDGSFRESGTTPRLKLSKGPETLGTSIGPPAIGDPAVASAARRELRPRLVCPPIGNGPTAARKPPSTPRLNWARQRRLQFALPAWLRAWLGACGGGVGRRRPRQQLRSGGGTGGR
eukprot:5751840-Pyramimonas_sp.AAC.1